MSKNAQVTLTVFNTAGFLALACALLLRGDGTTSAPTTPTSGTDAERIADLERRVARLEAAAADASGTMPSSSGEGATPSAAVEAPVSGESEAPEEPAAGAIAGASSPIEPADRPVTRREVEAIVAEQLAGREPTARAAANAAAPSPPARPRKHLREVARELGLDARQESTVRELYRQLERDAVKLLFDVDDAGLEQVKADLARAEHDPRLKEQLRERVAVNWARRANEVGVLWVKLDARLREVLGVEMVQRFYAFDVQPDEREFPDIGQMFFAPQQQEPGR